MLKTNTLKKLALCTFVAAACSAGQTAFAHTGIKDTATEGKTLYTAFTLGHGCQDTAVGDDDPLFKLLPVRGQSAVFPNGTASEAFKIDPIDSSETPITLSDHIQGAIGGVVTLSPGMVQDKNVFKRQKELTDANNNVRGIHFTVGKLDTTAVGLIPFRISAPKFVAESCAKSLKIRIGVANYCTRTKNENKDNRSDIWIGHMTTKFSDPGVMPHDFETSPFWPTLTVNRTTPLPDEVDCPDGYFDIAVQPSDDEIDTYLPVKGYWPK